MSLFGLRGRKFLDALQHHPNFPNSRFRLPCPPYDNPAFWDQLYKDMTHDTVNEWGGVDLTSSGLLQFKYQKMPIALKNSDGDDGAVDEQIISTTTFAKWMDITQLATPEEAIQAYQLQRKSNNHKNEAILILGCGNSKIGEQLLIHSFIGPILQLDISSKVIQLMTQRYQNYLSSSSSVVKRMEFFVDDATTGLTCLEPESVGGVVIDKGLLDVLHCSLGPMVMNGDDTNGCDDCDGDDNNMIQRIMSSVHNVLQPSRPFVFFSRSEPQWMLRRVFGNDGYLDLVNGGSSNRRSSSKKQQQRRPKLWKDVEVIKLIDYDLMLYKVVKADEDDVVEEEYRHDREQKISVTRRSYVKRLKGGSKPKR
jgi:hypothetical protein